MNNSNTVDPNTEINQINHYYPFGLNMEGNWNGASPTVGNKFQYNGKELNTDFDLNWNDYGARNYDPAIGRFTTADPMADFRNRVSPYQYVQNNPINRIDPTGMVDQSTAEKRAAMAQAVSENEKWMNSTRKDGGYWAAAKESMTIHLSSDKRKIKDFEGDDHEITQADIKGGAQTEVTTGHEEMLSYGTQCVVDSRAIFTSGCGCGGPGEPPCDALDPSTLGKNLFWMTYPGGTNPMKFNGLPDYSYNPGYRNLFEYPAIGHDRAYDILGIKGGSGLFLNVKAIGADWRFVKEEFNIAAHTIIFPYGGFMDTFKAAGLGIGLGLCATPKTVLFGLNPFLAPWIAKWGYYSTSHTNNRPSK